MFAPRLAPLLPLLAMALSTPSVASAETQREDAADIDSPFLWQVQSDKSPPSYLFGTVHAGVRLVDMPGSVSSAAASSRIFVMETSLPANFRTEPALDLELAELARSKGLPIASLESFRFQMRLLREFGAEDMAARLANDNSQELQDLLDLYRSGELSAIEELTRADNPDQNERLLYARNRAWIRKLVPALEQGGLFVAVGVAHYPGDQGLLSLLHTQGYSTRRLG